MTNDETNPSAEPKTLDAQAQQVARSLGEYWGRACVNAWRTVFPKRETRR